METVSLNSSGNKIVATIFRPETPNGFAIIMSCATGAKQGYYTKFANYYAERGFLMITYDYSGIGKSAPKSLKGFETNMSQWGESDLTAVIDYASENLEYKKLLLIGLSVGGQIPAMSPSISKVSGLINIASQSGYWKMWHFPIRYLLLFNWIVLSILVKIFGYFPGKRIGIMEDLPKGVALDWSNWGRSKEYLFDFILNAKEKYEAIKVPLISYSFSDDRTAPKQTVEWLNAKYSNCQLTYKHIHPSDVGMKKIGHFGFFKSKCKWLWDDLLKEIIKNF